MSTVEASMTSFGGNTFWGLVQQKGPWQTTSSDIKRATQSKPNYGGGGTGSGGTAHAGNGNWLQVMTPNQINGSAAPLKPSDYAMRSVMMSPVDMKKQTKIGRVKSKLTLASRAPFQTGQKMAMIPEEIRFDDPGQIKGEMQDELFSTSKRGSFISDREIDSVPTFVPPPPNPDQSRASEIARDAERQAVMEKRRGSFQLGPESAKRQQSAFGEVGFKRKEGGVEHVEKKKPRTMFQGPLSAPAGPSGVGTKRKAEKQIMSEKYKKVTRKPKLRIRTTDVGPRFLERRAERGAEPLTRGRQGRQPALRTRSDYARYAAARPYEANMLRNSYNAGNPFSRAA